jgi:membrane protein DedA with SNARE-associated domain
MNLDLEGITKSFASQGGLWAYLTVFFTTFIEGIFPPIPSDVVVLFCALLVAKGTLHWFPLFISALVGGTLGALLVYWIGYSKGRDFFLAKPRPFLSPQRLLEMESHFGRYGNIILAFNRAVIGGRSFGFLIAGLTGYKFRKVIVYGTPGIVLWYVLVIVLGIYFGERAKQMVNGIIMMVMIIMALSVLSLLVTKKLFK